MYSKQPLLRPVTSIVGTRGGRADGRGLVLVLPGDRAGKQPLPSLVATVVGTRGGGADGRGPFACPLWGSSRRVGQAQGPHVRSTAPLVPTTIIKRGDGNEHRTSSAAWEIRVTGTPGTWWHGRGLESAGYAIATPCGYQAAAC